MGWRASQGQRPDHHLRRVPPAGRRRCPVGRGPQRLRDRAGDRTELRDRYGRTTVRPELPAGAAAGRGRRALRDRQLRRLGPPREDLREPGQEAAGVRPRVLGPDQGPDERGLLDETLVVCMGEFGRTPKINKDAGRDHWARAGRCCSPARACGGSVIGATDKHGAFVTRRPVSPADVASRSTTRWASTRTSAGRPGRPADRDPRPGRGGQGVVLNGPIPALSFTMRRPLRLLLVVLLMAFAGAQGQPKDRPRGPGLGLYALQLAADPGKTTSRPRR